MTFGYERLSGRIESEPIDLLAEWLEATLGLRLTAYAANAKQTEIHQIAHGDSLPPGELEKRLRNLYAVTRWLAVRDRPASAPEWLMSPNSELEGRAPAEVLRDGETPEPVWFAAAPTF